MDMYTLEQRWEVGLRSTYRRWWFQQKKSYFEESISSFSIFVNNIRFQQDGATCHAAESTLYLGQPNTFFLENAKKKILNIFSNICSYLKVKSFRLIMENNFIQMTASAGHAVVYTIGPIFKHICQLSLACWRSTYLWRHPTNISSTVSNRSSEVAKRHQLCGW